ncbi:asparaginase [Isobaculum melis]|uniref:asparaginase n=1 Tax=Isobaculum melis TaxID=142588 RepID=A0A1H9TCU2_9LACT|nr:asparaginase [Isobaculum melis]SER94938.1 asparaginase [Isobaculum melis]
MKRILILHTGGTIAMSEDKETGKVMPNATNPLLAFSAMFKDNVDLIVEDIFQIPSPHITAKDMLLLKERIEQGVKMEQIDGVVITHGTDTLEETAYFLDITTDVSIPIVLTGAMRSSNEIGADGLYNFQSAIHVAASDVAKDKGVLVVMNDEIHTARYVTKTHTTNVATFRTPTFGPIGIIAKNKVLFFQELITLEKHPMTAILHDVQLVKAYAGMDSTIFHALAETKMDGLVIEALGAGNLPPATLPGIQNLIAKKIPIVLVSRCFNGIAQDAYDYEGGGKQLQEMGVIFTNGLNGQKARIKLLVALSQTTDLTIIKQFFAD